MLILSSQYYSPGSGLIPGPLKFAGGGCGIFVCLLAGFRLELLKAGSDSSLPGELVSLQGQRFSLDEFTWQG